MIDDRDDLLDRTADTLRNDPAPTGLSDRITQRVMAEIRSGERHHRRRTVGLRLGALVSGAAAASLVLWWLMSAGGAPPSSEAAPHRFALEAPEARSVAVVGDFNDWDPAASPMKPAEGGLWTVDLELPQGSHRYAFVIDGNRWLADPTTTARVVDDFGEGNSIVTIEGTS